MLAKHVCVYGMLVILDILQTEIGALQNHFTYLPGASLNTPKNTTVVSSKILCCNLCVQAGPACTLVGYSEVESTCELSATILVRFSFDLVVVDPWFKLYSSGSTYAWVEKLMTWSNAKLYCEANGWHLAHIQSSVEQDNYQQALQAQFGTPPGLRFWIGASRINGQLKWTDNTLVALDFGWDSSWNQPDNQGGIENCVAALTLGVYTWHDVLCTDMYLFICEYQ